MYDSYEISNYGETMVMGGCSFLDYDEVADKAYFYINLRSDKKYDKNKVKLTVNQLLTDCTIEEKVIGLDDLVRDAKEKIVDCNGIGETFEASDEMPFLIKNDNLNLYTTRVLDIVERSASLISNLTVTGISYDEGILRVQQCRGDLSNLDRYIQLYLKDRNGNERVSDCSVSWKEEIEGRRVSFNEDWFAISESELANYELYGRFYITDGSVNGKWEVIVNLD